jgi:hypothetical protein
VGRRRLPSQGVLRVCCESVESVGVC